MEPLMLFLIIVTLIMLAMGLGAGFWFGRMSASRPGMTVGIMDYSWVKHGLDPRPAYMKIHPKTGLYSAPANGPQSKGFIQVILKSGSFGMTKTRMVWEEASLVIPKDRRKGWGTYKAEILSEGLEQRVKALQFELGKVMLMNSELKRQLMILSNAQAEMIQQGVETNIKNTQKLLPPTVVKKNTSR